MISVMSKCRLAHFRNPVYMFTPQTRSCRSTPADLFPLFDMCRCPPPLPSTPHPLQDLPRTFPGHAWLQGPEGQAALRQVLVAFSVHNPKVGDWARMPESLVQGFGGFTALAWWCVLGLDAKACGVSNVVEVLLWKTAVDCASVPGLCTSGLVYHHPLLSPSVCCILTFQYAAVCKLQPQRCVILKPPHPHPPPHQVGYCQGLNSIVGLLLLATGRTPERAFWLLVALVERLLYPGTYGTSLVGYHVEMRTLDALISDKMPKLHAHLQVCRYASVCVCEAALCLPDCLCWWGGDKSEVQRYKGVTQSFITYYNTCGTASSSSRANVWFIMLCLCIESYLSHNSRRECRCCVRPF